MPTGVDKHGVIHAVTHDLDSVCSAMIEYVGSGIYSDVTCLACLHPPVVKNCRHPGAEIRNCPYEADYRSDYKQRCRCCEACAKECSNDL